MTIIAKREQLVDEANTRLTLPVPEFALTDRAVIIDRLMKEQDILEFIAARAAEQEISRDELMVKARKYAAEIGPKFSAWFYFRLGRFLATTLLRLHFRIRAVSVDEQILAGAPPGSTVILVSNHRSNFDPLVITYLASQRSTIALSAGEWARLWPLHHFVRAAGGFVVDRDADDPLYRRVLAAYVRMSAANGLHQAFFPEGELSRDGEMSPPKLGFLDFYCRACSEDRDIVFVPVGINYDRIPEDRKLARAEGSFENPKATFLIGSSLRYIASVLALPFRRRAHRYGHACVAFGAPVSLREWLGKHDIGIGELGNTERYHWLPNLADELMRRCAGEIPVPPVVLAAAVMCRDPVRETWSKDELRDEMERLAARLRDGGAHVYSPESMDDPTAFALDMLLHEKLIRRADNDAWSIVRSDLSVLRHYANSVRHLAE